MDADIAAALGKIKAGPISKLTKPDLLIIAASLSIPISISGPDKQNVNEIKIILKQALAAPNLAFSEAYQKFIVYPRGHHAPSATSADKATQDNLQAKSGAVPAAGSVFFCSASSY